MRNILITVMMLIVVAALFSSIIADDTNGIGAKIKQQGTNAATKIEQLSN
ncbi:MAG TPA: hypothetical protein VF260_07360 [Bacilli bacterium]